MGILKASPLDHVPTHFAIIGRVFMLLNGLSHRLVPGERVIAMVVAKTLMAEVVRNQASLSK